ncbi:hypothetical protein [Nonomuraea cavernae]|uniref:Uncharacterized protein n=1 Tax=Nonomuraea cavernae TaxID=2045107 RepID=A0A917ZI53_9ACTN|nr:hypothetical protein [Nonomuraea cavernae]MCA2189985.1 hypothetical protein [Nonomuraea cavernae]GGO82449.1 hypothetical protein GCM10012289_73710 [Nonomuraea cavernae]
MRSPWLYAVAALAILAVAWVVAPLRAEPPPRFVRPSTEQPASAPAVRELTGPVPAPIRYAYAPSCQDGDACRHWILVSARGERWWLPGAGDEVSLGLSADGLRVAYRSDAAGGFVVRDLKTGTTRSLTVKPEASIGEFIGVRPPLLSPDGRHLLVQNDHLDKNDEVVLERPLIVDTERGTVTRLPGGETVIGWTAAGLALVRERSTDSLPGHVSTASFVIRSPGGKAVRRTVVPGNQSRAWFSPSGRTLASLAREVTPDDLVTTGVVLVGTSKGHPTRTVTPRQPAGRRIAEILRWEDENTLVVRTADAGDTGNTGSYHFLDLRDGATRPIEISVPVGDDLRETAPVLGSVR